MRKKNKNSNAVKTSTDIERVTKSTELFIKSVIEGLQLSDGEFLLAVCFVTDEAREYHKLFPSVLGLDVVFGTNAEKRPQMRGTGKTASNKNLPLIDALLPSQQKWIFDWFINDALPSLLDRDALLQTKIILTDQDKELMGVIDSALKNKDKVYGGAVRRICKWHKVNDLNRINRFKSFCRFIGKNPSPLILFVS